MRLEQKKVRWHNSGACPLLDPLIQTHYSQRMTIPFKEQDWRLAIL